MRNDLDKLKQAVEKACHCEANHARSEAVIETFRGDTVWSGMVEVYALAGNPEAQCAYAWCYPEGAETRYMTVMRKPPVTDALSAVRAAIASGQQK